MENNYPFHVNTEEFKNKRVLVTGGTKGAAPRQPARHCPKINDLRFSFRLTWGVRPEYSSSPTVSFASGAESTSW